MVLKGGIGSLLEVFGNGNNEILSGYCYEGLNIRKVEGRMVHVCMKIPIKNFHGMAKELYVH